MGAEATVLIVEDDTALATTYARMLEPDWDVSVVNDGETALARLDGTVDVVLLDRELPGRSGDTVLREMRRRGVDCRIALVTGQPPKVDVLELGFDEYLVKPVDRHELHEVVERLVARSRYTHLTQQLYAALRKRELLRERHSEADLQNHDEYQSLLAEIESLRSKARTLGTDLQHGDFRALFFEIGQSAEGSSRDRADA